MRSLAASIRVRGQHSLRRQPHLLTVSEAQRSTYEILTSNNRLIGDKRNAANDVFQRLLGSKRNCDAADPEPRKRGCGIDTKVIQGEQ